MNNSKFVDWGLTLTVIGLLITVIDQTTSLYERLARLEAAVTSETTLCDCFNTRTRVGSLEYRVDALERNR